VTYCHAGIGSAFAPLHSGADEGAEYPDGGSLAIAAPDLHERSARGQFDVMCDQTRTRRTRSRKAAIKGYAVTTKRGSVAPDLRRSTAAPFPALKLSLACDVAPRDGEGATDKLVAALQEP